MSIEKHPWVEDRIRRLPQSGWSWIDRRFLRDHAPRLSGDAIYLYFFLAAVSDKEGLSYWGEAAVATRLRMSESTIVHARHELERAELIAYRPPLYQVLSLPVPAASRPRQSRGQPLGVGEVLRRAVEARGRGAQAAER